MPAEFIAAIARSSMAARSPTFDPSECKRLSRPCERFAIRTHTQKQIPRAPDALGMTAQQFRGVCRASALEQGVLGARRLKAEMFIGQRRGHAAALGTVEQAQLHQIR